MKHDDLAQIAEGFLELIIGQPVLVLCLQWHREQLGVVVVVVVVVGFWQ